MKLSLCIQVYNGGKDWQECWNSVLSNIDFFDNIFVSVSRSPVWEEDISLVKSCALPKIHLLVHEERMSAVEHGKKIDDWISSFQLEGHVFLLCHDDILLSRGLEELSRLDLRHEDGVFGSWHFFSPENTKRDLIVRQFCFPEFSPIDKQTFLFMLDQQQYAMNISGLVIPAAIYNDRYLPWDLCNYGYRSELLHFSSPHIQRVYQLTFPAVKIRQRNDSEGALAVNKDIYFDTLLSQCVLFHVAQKEASKKFIMRGIAYIFGQNNFFRSACDLGITQYRLWKNKYLTLYSIVQIWGRLLFLIVEFVCRKVIKRAK